MKIDREEESIQEKKSSTVSNATEQSRRMSTENRPLDLAIIGSLVTLDKEVLAEFGRQIEIG